MEDRQKYFSAKEHNRQNRKRNDIYGQLKIEKVAARIYTIWDTMNKIVRKLLLGNHNLKSKEEKHEIIKVEIRLLEGKYLIDI